MNHKIVCQIPMNYLDRKYDGDINYWFAQQNTDAHIARDSMSVTGFTDIPVSYKEAVDFYGYNVICKVIKCRKLELSAKRKEELEWLITEEQEKYGLSPEKRGGVNALLCLFRSVLAYWRTMVLSSA